MNASPNNTPNRDGAIDKNATTGKPASDNGAGRQSQGEQKVAPSRSDNTIEGSDPKARDMDGNIRQDNQAGGTTGTKAPSSN